MALLLKSILVWVLSSILLKIMVSLGIAFFAYSTFHLVIDNFLVLAHGLISGLPADLLAILSKLGVFKSFSIIGSAMTTIAAVKSIKLFVGLK